MQMYDEGELFKEKQWHDSWIFDIVRIELEKKSLKNINICSLGLRKDNDILNVFDNSVLGEFMNHLKGKKRKRIKL